MTATEWKMFLRDQPDDMYQGHEEDIIADLWHAEEQAQEYRLDWKYEMVARKLAEDEVDRLCKALEDKRRAG